MNTRREPRPDGWALWRRWVVANALGEALGLGAVGLLGALASRLVGPDPRGGAAVAFAGVLVALGALEGVVVGAAQWRALRPTLPALPARAWIVATSQGALVAWALGMLPSTIMSLGAGGTGAPSAPPAWVRYAAAVGLGLVAGPVLAAFQWRVLRRHVPRAGWWMPANAAAWALAMPMIFALAHALAGRAAGVTLVVAALAVVTAAGAVVGAVHGAALAWLINHDGAGARPVRGEAQGLHASA